MIRLSALSVGFSAILVAGGLATTPPAWRICRDEEFTVAVPAGMQATPAPRGHWDRRCMYHWRTDCIPLLADLGPTAELTFSVVKVGRVGCDVDRFSAPYKEKSSAERYSRQKVTLSDGSDGLLLVERSANDEAVQLSVVLMTVSERHRLWEVTARFTGPKPLSQEQIQAIVRRLRAHVLSFVLGKESNVNVSGLEEAYESTEASADDLSTAQYSKARASLKSKKYDAAIRQAKAASRARAPEIRLGALRILGKALEAKGDLKGAVDAYKSAVEVAEAESGGRSRAPALLLPRIRALERKLDQYR